MTPEIPTPGRWVFRHPGEVIHGVARRRSFPDEFKRDAVDLVRSSKDRTLTDIARGPGIHLETLRNWVREDATRRSRTLDGGGDSSIGCATSWAGTAPATEPGTRTRRHDSKDGLDAAAPARRRYQCGSGWGATAVPRARRLLGAGLSPMAAVLALCAGSVLTFLRPVLCQEPPDELQAWSSEAPVWLSRDPALCGPAASVAQVSWNCGYLFFLRGGMRRAGPADPSASTWPDVRSSAFVPDYRPDRPSGGNHGGPSDDAA